jgi:hypothetical protein
MFFLNFDVLIFVVLTFSPNENIGYLFAADICSSFFLQSMEQFGICQIHTNRNTTYQFASLANIIP